MSRLHVDKKAAKHQGSRSALFQMSNFKQYLCALPQTLVNVAVKPL